MVAPMVQRCEVCAKLELEAVWKPEGSRQLGAILKRMAEIIDDEIDRREGR